MTPVKRNGSLLTHLPMMFDDIFSRDIFNFNQSNFSETNTSLPAANIIESPEGYALELAAPGMSKKDFKVQLDGNMLTISSERKNEETVKDGEKAVRTEFSYQSFQRSFELPKSVVESEKISAKYEDGVLKLMIPKREEAKPKPPKLIEIA